MEGATCMAICQFSLGATFREMLCRFVGIDLGYYLIQGSLQKSSERLKKAEVKSSNERKKRRKMLKFKNITKIQRTIANEGPPYKADDFA